MNPKFLAVLSTMLISLISLLGLITLSWKKDRLQKSLTFLVSFAVGAIIGDVFIHILPEAYKNSESTLLISLSVLAGFMIFFVIEKFVNWKHFNLHLSEEDMPPVVAMNLIGDAAHNFIDGMLIGVSYLVSIPLGISTTIAILLHEIPQEIGDFGILVQGGVSIKKALKLNLICSLFAVVGVFLSLFIGHYSETYILILLPITAGGFIYIAGPDLIPILHKENKIKTSIMQFIAINLGILIMILLTIIE
jgi:zinc and cadmium transporter